MMEEYLEWLNALTVYRMRITLDINNNIGQRAFLFSLPGGGDEYKRIIRCKRLDPGNTLEENSRIRHPYAHRQHCPAAVQHR